MIKFHEAPPTFPEFGLMECAEVSELSNARMLLFKSVEPDGRVVQTAIPATNGDGSAIDPATVDSTTRQTLESLLQDSYADLYHTEHGEFPKGHPDSEVRLAV